MKRGHQHVCHALKLGAPPEARKAAGYTIQAHRIRHLGMSRQAAEAALEAAGLALGLCLVHTKKAAEPKDARGVCWSLATCTGTAPARFKHHVLVQSRKGTATLVRGCACLVSFRCASPSACIAKVGCRMPSFVDGVHRVVWCVDPNPQEALNSLSTEKNSPCSAEPRLRK